MSPNFSCVHFWNSSWVSYKETLLTGIFLGHSDSFPMNCNHVFSWFKHDHFFMVFVVFKTKIFNHLPRKFPSLFYHISHRIIWNIIYWMMLYWDNVHEIFLTEIKIVKRFFFLFHIEMYKMCDNFQIVSDNCQTWFVNIWVHRVQVCISYQIIPISER